MKRFVIGLLLLALAMPTHAYKSGKSPFCMQDEYGNLECYYALLTTCQYQLKWHPRSTCVRNPDWEDDDES